MKRKPPGLRRAPEREGDKKQARDRIAYLVRIGRIPRARRQACAECGTRAAEYHHRNGYGIGYHEDVIPLCKWCHAQADSADCPDCAAYDEIPD